MFRCIRLCFRFSSAALNRPQWLFLLGLAGVLGLLTTNKTIRAGLYINHAALLLITDDSHAASPESGAVIQAQLQTAHRVCPECPSFARLELIRALEQQDIDRASQLLAESSFLWDRDYLPAILVGMACWEHGERAQARTIFGQAVEANPMALLVLADALGNSSSVVCLPANTETGQLLKDLSYIALRHHALSPEVFIKVGRAFLLALKEPALAQTWLELGRVAHPGDAGILYHLFAAVMSRSNHDLALQYLSELAASSGWSQWMPEYELHLQRGGLLLERPEYLREALREFEQAIELAPESSYAHLRLAGAYEQAGLTSNARQQYSQVLDLEPEPGVDVTWVRRHLAALNSTP